MRRASEINGRFFIVGSARSGTTLLQSMIASHSRVFSFPESHFFCTAAPRGRVRGRLGIVRRPRARSAFNGLLKSLERPDLAHMFPSQSPLFRSHARSFMKVIDMVALADGKDYWVEKTPHHIDFIPLIDSVIPNAHFIHVLRDGRDVLASQFHANNQDPEYWGNWPLPKMIGQWNSDVTISLGYRGTPRHLVVHYEDVLQDPEACLRRVADFMGIEFEESMLRHWESADRVVGWRKTDPWMQKAFQPLEDTRLKKFFEVFTEDQRRQIVDNLLWGGEVRRDMETARV